MERLTRARFAQMVDMVELAPVTTREMVDALIADAGENGFHSLGCPYCYHPYVISRVKELDLYERLAVLGGGGFPDGNWPTKVKLESIRLCLENGCREIDLTTNLGWIKSGMLKEYRDEVEQVRAMVKGLPLKVIIHAPQLTEREIEATCRIAMEAGADFIKTDTGRSPTPSTPEQVRLIRVFVGDRMKIKASGGIRNVETVMAMLEAGTDRFGMSRSGAMAVYHALPET
jgi:deoxyribose-phosphate aldolase